MEMCRNIVIGQIADDELKKAGGDLDKVEVKKPLRRIKDAGWDVGAVVVQGKREGASSGPTVAVWKDPKTGRVRATLQPIATDGKSVIPLPGDVQAEVLAVDEKGRIDTVTKTTVTVGPERIATIDSDSGETTNVAYDDFEKNDSNSIVTADEDGTPSSAGTTPGLNTVDLTQFYPTDDNSNDTRDIQDYDPDSPSSGQNSIWSDNGGSTSLGDLADAIQDHLDNGDDWQTIEGDPRWSGDDTPRPPRDDDRTWQDDGGPTTLSNLADRLGRPGTNAGDRRNESDSVPAPPGPIADQPTRSTPGTKNFVHPKWPNPTVFFERGVTEIPGEQPMSILLHVLPRECNSRSEPEEWRGKRTWMAGYRQVRGPRVFDFAWIWVRPLEQEDANLLAAAQQSFRFQGTNWPVRSLNTDGTILFAYRTSKVEVDGSSFSSAWSGLGIVSAGGHLAVMQQYVSRNRPEAQRQLLQVLRNQLERASQQN